MLAGLQSVAASVHLVWSLLSSPLLSLEADAFVRTSHLDLVSVMKRRFGAVVWDFSLWVLV